MSNISSMNWYGKILYSQIWTTKSDGSFQEDLVAFYELEYKYQSLKNYEFTGMPQRYESILEKVEEAFYEIMERLKETLILTFRGWLETHAITEPALWAERRTDPYGEGFMSSFDATNNLEGIIGEYIRYQNGGQVPVYNRPNTETVFSNMLGEALEMSNQFSSLQGVTNMIQIEERERLENDLYSDDFENFGINERGEAFQSEEEAKAYIEERVKEADIGHFAQNFGKQEFMSLLEGSGQMETFLVELNQHLVFPLWYNYWRGMGIDDTRDMVEEAYKNLTSASSFEEFHLALEVAIQTCHQGGSMLDYLSEYGGEDDSNPQEIENIMTELTGGKSNAEWDKQLKAIGVKVPGSVKKHNLQMAKV